MAISKNQKQLLIEEYKALLDGSHHVFLIKQSGIDVNTSSVLRKQLVSVGAKMMVVRKRLLLRSAATSSCEEVTL
jgi:ribosomal protein L10